MTVALYAISEIKDADDLEFQNVDGYGIFWDFAQQRFVMSLANIPDLSAYVTGPETSIDGNFALFDGINGNVLKDTGINASSFDPAGAAAAVQGNLDTHAALTNNPHSVDKGQVGLGNADNTADPDKPVSTAQQAALDLKEDGLGNPLSDGFVLSSTIAGVRSWVAPGGSGGGDVTGPASAVDQNVAIFNGATGKVIADGGAKVSDFEAAGAAAVVQGNLDAHEANVANPHAVTAAQAGADPAGSAGAVQTNLDAHEADTTDIHGIANTAALETVTGSQAKVDAHANLTNNPHSVDQAQVGLANVDDTADLDKPISNATQAALNGKEDGLGNPATDGFVLASTIAGVRSWVAPGGAGGGDVSGPESAVNDNFALFSGTSGKVIKDTGINAGSFDAAGAAAAVQSNLDTHTANVSNPHSVDKAQVGLGNVDNTADADKPISDATQAALDGKEDDLGNPTTSGDILSSTDLGVRSWITPNYDPAGSADAVQSNLDTHTGNVANPHSVTQAQVGLGNVDNTADLDKPISNATQAALNGKAAVAPNDTTSYVQKGGAWVAEQIQDKTSLAGIGFDASVDASVSGAITLDFSANNVFFLTLVGNATMSNPSSVLVGQTVNIVIDNSGAHSITGWGSNWRAADGTAPDITGLCVLSCQVYTGNLILVTAVSNLSSIV